MRALHRRNRKVGPDFVGQERSAGVHKSGLVNLRYLGILQRLANQ
jgi:hypothetical protein